MNTPKMKILMVIFCKVHDERKSFLIFIGLYCLHIQLLKLSIYLFSIISGPSGISA